MAGRDDIVFLGYVVPREVLKKHLPNGVAGNNMQMNIINGLLKHKGTSITCISLLPIAPYPRSKVMRHRREVLKTENGIEVILPKFCNLPLIKQFSQSFAVYREAKKIVGANPQATILCYNLFPQIGLPMRWLKRKFPQSIATAIIADPPISPYITHNVISKTLRKLFDRTTIKNISRCDRFIVVNKKVSDFYLNNQPYLVVDGGIAKPETVHHVEGKKKSKNVLFSGALTDYNGIDLLIEAMGFLKDLPIELDIYGCGELEEYIRGKQAENDRIHFHGFISNEDIQGKQNESWLLVNPRKVDYQISQVTFPSKILEYMLSGTPILSTKLNCFGEEYKDIMLYCDCTPEAIAQGIRDAYGLDEQEYRDIALRAQNFVLNERTWDKQTERIAAFLFDRAE